MAQEILRVKLQLFRDPTDYRLLGSSVHGIYRQEYWSGLPFPVSEDLPDPGVKLVSPAWQTDSLPLSHLGSPPDRTHNCKP